MDKSMDITTVLKSAFLMHHGELSIFHEATAECIGQVIGQR